MAVSNTDPTLSDLADRTIVFIRQVHHDEYKITCTDGTEWWVRWAEGSQIRWRHGYPNDR